MTLRFIHSPSRMDCQRNSPATDTATAQHMSVLYALLRRGAIWIARPCTASAAS